jgi:hypothetical protein
LTPKRLPACAIAFARGRPKEDRMRSTLTRLAAAGTAGAVALPAAVAAAAGTPAPTTPPAIKLPVPGKHAVADPLHTAVKNRLVRHDARLARTHARLRGHRFHRHDYVAEARTWPVARLEREGRALRRKIRVLRRQAAAPAVSPALRSIAACESGGNPRAIGGGGAFRGKYQFTYGTWAAMGGKGDPAAAPEAEQDRRAAALLASAGPGQWPVCGA